MSYADALLQTKNRQCAAAAHKLLKSAANSELTAAVLQKIADIYGQTSIYCVDIRDAEAKERLYNLADMAAEHEQARKIETFQNEVAECYGISPEKVKVCSNKDCEVIPGQIFRNGRGMFTGSLIIRGHGEHNGKVVFFEDVHTGSMALKDTTWTTDVIYNDDNDESDIVHIYAIQLEYDFTEAV